MKIEDCEGCKTRVNTGECIWFNESLVCPCASCLIKVMCSSRCDLLRDHTAKVYKAIGIITLEDKIDHVVGVK